MFLAGMESDEYFRYLNIVIFQDLFSTKLPISRTEYTRFKSNKARYVWKRIAYLMNIWSIVDIFMVLASPHYF